MTHGFGKTREIYWNSETIRILSSVPQGSNPHSWQQGLISRQSNPATLTKERAPPTGSRGCKHRRPPDRGAPRNAQIAVRQTAYPDQGNLLTPPSAARREVSRSVYHRQNHRGRPGRAFQFFHPCSRRQFHAAASLPRSTLSARSCIPLLYQSYAV